VSIVEPFGDVPRIAADIADRACVAIQGVREHEHGIEVCFRADGPVPMYCCTILAPGLSTPQIIDQLVEAASRASDAVVVPSPLPIARALK